MHWLLASGLHSAELTSWVVNSQTSDRTSAGTYTHLTDLTSFLNRLLLTAQRTASLRQDDDCQAVLINLLLRNYLHYNLYDQADKLVSKTTFPTSAGNPQLARYYYYLGRIKAVQLNYTAAHTHLLQALRRAPPAKVAPGFFQAVHKSFIIVELLMGDIPERSLFRHPVLEKALTGYFQIVRGKCLDHFIIRLDLVLILSFSR